MRSIRTIVRCFFTLLLFAALLLGGQNSDAFISIDGNYFLAGNQRTTRVETPQIGDTLTFEIRADQCLQLDTYAIDLVYEKTDFEFVGVYADNWLFGGIEENMLRSNDAKVLSPGVAIDSAGLQVRIRLLFSSTNRDPQKAASGEGLLALCRLIVKRSPTEAITIEGAQLYDTAGVPDVCPPEQLGKLEFEQGSLPVTLSSFRGFCLGNAVHLLWTTETENSSYAFFIYRSLDKDKNFCQIHSSLIKAAGNSTQRRAYQFADTTVTAGKVYFYKIQQVDYTGERSTFGPISVSTANLDRAAPQVFSFYENYPNPFNPRTAIQFDLPSTENVLLEVFDVRGHKVKTLVNEQRQPGTYIVQWDGTNFEGQSVSSGTYFCRIIAGSFQGVRKMMVLK